MWALSSILFAALVALPLDAAAACWRVGNLKGTGARAGDGYRFSPDGFAGQEFQLDFARRDAAAVSPANGLQCTGLGPSLITCVGADGGGGMSVWTWSVDVESKRAMITFTRSGNGLVDGAAVLVGDVLGPCK